jgi:hypothetical protein
VARRRIGRGAGRKRRKEEEDGCGYHKLRDCRMILIIKEPRFVTDDPLPTYSHTPTYLLDTVRKDEKNQSASVYL